MIAVGLIGVVGAPAAQAAPSATLRLDGPSSVTAGSTFVQTSHVVVTDDGMNVAEVDLSYDSRQLAFLGADSTGSPMSPIFNGGGGGQTMFVSAFYGGTVSGDVIVSNTRFRAGCLPGTTTVGYLPSTAAVSGTSNQAIPLTSTRKSIKVVAAPVGTLCAQPSVRGRGATSSSVTVYGTGFTSGTAVSFGSGVTVSKLAVNSSTTAVATVSVSSTAALGDRDVVATSGGTVSRCTGCFTISPAPAPSSLDTATIAAGTTVNTSVRGSGFTAGARIAVSGAGVSSPVTLFVPGRLDVAFTTASTASAGQRTLTVTNPDGGQGRCTGCLTVTR